MQSVSPSELVYQAGTLSVIRWRCTWAAVFLRYLKEHPGTYTELEEKVYLKEGMQTILQEMKLPYQLHQAGKSADPVFTNLTERSLALRMCRPAM